jgi:predicted regulator of Ras-like GTPase activity (Roadblock/LC7/MglB family)
VSTAQHPVHDLDWLVTDFAERVRHVAHAVVVSADGFALAFSAGLPRGHADRLAAVTSGLAGLADGAARTFGAGEVIQTAVEMEAGLLVTMPAGNGSTLAVLAGPECDLGLVCGEMSLLAERAGRELTPATRREYDPGSPLPAVPLQAGVREVGDSASDYCPGGHPT